MPVANRDVPEVIRLMRIYLRPGPARQLAGDLMRSEVAKHNESFRITMERVWKALRGEIAPGSQGYDEPPDRERIADGLRRYAEHHGALHEDDCPADDTCACRFRAVNEAVNDAVRYFEGGAP